MGRGAVRDVLDCRNFAIADNYAAAAARRRAIYARVYVVFGVFIRDKDKGSRDFAGAPAVVGGVKPHIAV